MFWNEATGDQSTSFNLALRLSFRSRHKRLEKDTFYRLNIVFLLIGIQLLCFKYHFLCKACDSRFRGMFVCSGPNRCFFWEAYPICAQWYSSSARESINFLNNWRKFTKKVSSNTWKIWSIERSNLMMLIISFTDHESTHFTSMDFRFWVEFVPSF